MADDILAEALARVEYKLDMIIKHHQLTSVPMHFPGQPCPVCKAFIEYQVDVMKNVVVRRCQCATGKIAPSISIIPLTPGAIDGSSPSQSSTFQGDPFQGEPSSKDRNRR